MNILTAKKLTYEAVDKLKDSGIKVSIVESRSRDNPKTVEKYNIEGRLPPEHWNHVTFFPSTEDEINRIDDEMFALLVKNIVFDTGGCAGKRDWELDWSFHMSLDTTAAAEGKKIVVDLINNIA